MPQSHRAPLSFRVMEAVEARLRRLLSPAGLRVAYRLAHVLLRPWWFLTRPRTRGVKAVVRRGDRVLLVRHTYGRRSEWALPGGFIHPDEEPSSALRRELAEELGIQATAVRALAQTPSRHDFKREVLYAFVADVDGEDVTPSVAEIAQTQWFAHDALPRETTEPYTRRMVARAYWPADE